VNSEPEMPPNGIADNKLVLEILFSNIGQTKRYSHKKLKPLVEPMLPCWASQDEDVQCVCWNN